MILIAQMALDLTPDRLTSPGQLSRHGRLVFFQEATGFRQGQLLRVVAPEPQTIAVGQPRQRSLERTLNAGTISGVMWIGRARAGCRNGVRPLVGRQRFEPTGGSNAVDMPLREHGTEPCLQRAAAMVIPEQRLPFTVALANAEQLAVNGIGDLARTSRPVESLGCPIESRPMLLDEVIPRTLVTGCAGAGQRQIFEVESVKISRQIRRGRAGGTCVQ